VKKAIAAGKGKKSTPTTSTTHDDDDNTTQPAKMDSTHAVEINKQHAEIEALRSMVKELQAPRPPTTSPTTPLQTVSPAPTVSTSTHADAAKHRAEIEVLRSIVNELQTMLETERSARRQPAASQRHVSIAHPHGTAGHQATPKTHPPEHYCAVSLQLMRDPVLTLCRCGSTYERSAVQQWWALGNTSCPMCLSALASTTLVPNVALRGLIQAQAL
jgi:hypothetical protein